MCVNKLSNVVNILIVNNSISNVVNSLIVNNSINQWKVDYNKICGLEVLTM